MGDAEESFWITTSLPMLTTLMAVILAISSQAKARFTAAVTLAPVFRGFENRTMLMPSWRKGGGTSSIRAEFDFK